MLDLEIVGTLALCAVIFLIPSTCAIKTQVDGADILLIADGALLHNRTHESSAGVTKKRPGPQPHHNKKSQIGNNNAQPPKNVIKNPFLLQKQNPNNWVVRNGNRGGNRNLNGNKNNRKKTTETLLIIDDYTGPGVTQVMTPQIIKIPMVLNVRQQQFLTTQSFNEQQLNYKRPSYEVNKNVYQKLLSHNPVEVLPMSGGHVGGPRRKKKRRKNNNPSREPLEPPEVRPGMVEDSELPVTKRTTTLSDDDKDSPKRPSKRNPDADNVPPRPEDNVPSGPADNAPSRPAARPPDEDDKKRPGVESPPKETEKPKTEEPKKTEEKEPKKPSGDSHDKDKGSGGGDEEEEDEPPPDPASVEQFQKNMEKINQLTNGKEVPMFLFRCYLSTSIDSLDVCEGDKHFRKVTDQIVEFPDTLKEDLDLTEKIHARLLKVNLTWPDGFVFEKNKFEVALGDLLTSLKSKDKTKLNEFSVLGYYKLIQGFFKTVQTAKHKPGDVFVTDVVREIVKVKNLFLKRKLLDYLFRILIDEKYRGEEYEAN